VASEGVNVAVSTEVPAPTIVSVFPLTVATEVVADEYVNVPRIEPFTAGAVKLKLESPYVAEASLHDRKVGVNLLIVIAVDAEFAVK
jgi:hypothetical protein